MAYVQTTEGVHVEGKKGATDRLGELTLEQAEHSANERNKLAEEMGLKVRYEAVTP